MLLRLPPRILARPLARPLEHPRTFRRYKFDNSSFSRGQPAPEEPSVIMENLQKQTLSAFDTFRRLIKFSFVGIVAVGITAGTAFEGAHMWVEKIALAPEMDQEVCKWEWDREFEKWSGGDTGGTDTALGFRGRHAVRSAWMAQNWGTGEEANIIGSNAFRGRGPSGAGGLNVVEARLEYAQGFLSMAISIAEKGIRDGKVNPQTLTALLSRHGGVLERMGSPYALFESRSQFERVWAGLPGKGIDAARVSLKLGDLNHRLGDEEDALAWWARSIQLSLADVDKRVGDATPAVPALPPPSPLAQRTLASTLVSLSAFYATSGQLRQAEAVEEGSLHLLRSIRPPESLASTSPPQALHHLYLVHRSSLLSIHLAEVLFALRMPMKTSVQSLKSAAESSERVALALTGLPTIHPDAPRSQIPHPPSSEAPLLAVYKKSISMSRPASNLLRDARRTAAEAWNLLGVLTEESTNNAPEKALECYERALGWAGVAANRPGGIGEASEGVLEADWKVLWGNYVRARDAVRKQTGDP